MTVRIAIDCMGGDHGPAVTLPAARAFLKHEPEAHLDMHALKSVLGVKR